MIRHRQKIIADRQLGTMMSIGFVSSAVLHLGLIAGISHWWKPSAPIDEPLEITLVESVVDKAPSPITPPPKPASKPKLTALKPIPIPTPIAPIPPSIPLAVTPTPIATPKPQPIAIKSTPKPIPPKPAAKPKPITPNPISKPIPPAIVNPPIYPARSR